jgi:hypothetical protein
MTGGAEVTLPLSLSRYHTAWVSCAECRPRPVRYAIDGDRMVCFGDQLPRDVANGRHLFITVHEIAGGPAVTQMTGVLRDVDAADVRPNALLDLLEHVSLGRNADEVAAAITRHKARRLVVLAEEA